LLISRCYPILDTAVLDRRGFSVLEASEILLEQGVRMLQLRHKTPYSREMFDVAATIAQYCRNAGAMFIVNDRADIAMLLDAGLHVGQDDLPLSSARRLIGPGRTLGFSTHNGQQLIKAGGEPVDYLAIGPIFATSSKTNPDIVVGVEALRNLRRLTDKPLVAIGGITRQTAPEVLAAGADAIAVIGDLYPEPLSRRGLETSVCEWLAVTGRIP
jgi:thiamine-phosphate pyrophosphorylase